jgi:hypothetical protein
MSYIVIPKSFTAIFPSIGYAETKEFQNLSRQVNAVYEFRKKWPSAKLAYLRVILRGSVVTLIRLMSLGL